MAHADSALYLVPNTHGGKTLVRRVHPPPTTAAIDSDFDAYTIPATSVVGSHWVRESRRESRAPPHSIYDGRGYENPFGGAVEVVVRESSRYGSMRSERTETLRTMESRSRSMLGSGVGSGISSTTGREHSTRHGHERTRAVAGDSDRRWDSMGKRARHPKGGGMAPGGSKTERPRLVEYRVLEDTPERTVSIWREEVAHSSTTDGSTLAGDAHQHGRRSEVDSHPHRRRPSKVTKENHAPPKTRRNEYPNGKNYDASSPSRSGLGLSNMPRPPPFRSVSDPLPPVTMAQSTIYTLKTPILQAVRAPSTFLSPRKPHGTTTQGSFASSTPKIPSRRPTNSRRTSDATTVKATSTSSVETILAANRPPLLHLMPILKQLGITQKDHLRAVGQMSEVIRNSELKEAILSRGVTVIDWAILIDLARRT